MAKTIHALITFTLFCFSSIVFAASPQYAIIVDAGSTGSRLHLFQYEIQDSVPVIQDIFSEKISPGIATFASHPEDAGPSYKVLLDDAVQQLKNKGVTLKNVPISILGTAGMRLLSQKEQDAIYHSLKNYIASNYSFSLHGVGFSINSFATISGKMEGVYGWLDVNYLAENLQNKTPTLGSIDMGGASAEITFATTPNGHDGADELNLTVNGVNYTLFSKSFLGMGQDQAIAAIKNNSTYISCFPKNYTLDATHQGEFNFSTCVSLFANLINENHVSESVLPIPAQTFVAFGGIYSTENFFAVDATPEHDLFEKTIQDVCALSWEDLKTKYSNVPEKYLASDCAYGVYDEHLIYDAFLLDGSHLRVTDKINNKAIDWTLGALLYSLITAPSQN